MEHDERLFDRDMLHQLRWELYIRRMVKLCVVAVLNFYVFFSFKVRFGGTVTVSNVVEGYDGGVSGEGDSVGAGQG